MFLLWLRQLSRCGDRTPASVPPPTKGTSSPTDTPVFPPSSLSYWVLRGSTYSFPLVRYSCPLSAGVLHALLCLKVYSWCIHEERCTPRPPTPQPSCILGWNSFAFWHNISWGTNEKFGPKLIHLSYSPLEFDYTLGCSQMFWNFSVWTWNL